jgi:hypothetical protein
MKGKMRVLLMTAMLVYGTGYPQSDIKKALYEALFMEGFSSKFAKIENRSVYVCPIDG